MPFLSQSIVRRTLTLTALTILSASPALAQDLPSQLTSPTVTSRRESAISPPQPNEPQYADWSRLGQLHLGGKYFVITRAHPIVRHTCNVRSFTVDQLACKDSLGATHIYKPQEIAALIIPGEYDFRLRFVLGANAVMAAAIWGTIALVPVCAPCAAATAFAAFVAFAASGSILTGDEKPDSLLYLAPGQTLRVRLRY